MRFPHLSTTEYESRRRPIKRRCVQAIRRALAQCGQAAQLPSSALDAIYTLTALNFTPSLIAEFVSVPGFTELHVLRALARIATECIVSLIYIKANHGRAD